jgi:hypothetical protein
VRSAGQSKCLRDARPFRESFEMNFYCGINLSATLLYPAIYGVTAPLLAVDLWRVR